MYLNTVAPARACQLEPKRQEQMFNIAEGNGSPAIENGVNGLFIAGHNLAPDKVILPDSTTQ
jgi:hypothetical protein